MCYPAQEVNNSSSCSIYLSTREHITEAHQAFKGVWCAFLNMVIGIEKSKQSNANIFTE